CKYESGSNRNYQKRKQECREKPSAGLAGTHELREQQCSECNQGDRERKLHGQEGYVRSSREVWTETNRSQHDAKCGACPRDDRECQCLSKLSRFYRLNICAEKIDELFSFHKRFSLLIRADNAFRPR